MIFLNGLLNGQMCDFEVANGRIASILPAGSLAGRSTPSHDLQGLTVLPGFIDAHCHILPTGLDLQKLNLTECQSRQDVLDAVATVLAQGGEGWLHAVQYDQNKYGAHLTRHDLDAVAPDRPVLLRHSNGHASVANSAALRAAGVREDEPDPAGGEFQRDAAGALTGVLFERAHENVTSAAPAPDLEEMVAAILRAGERMASLGITCASDMMTGRWDLELELQAYHLAAQRGMATRTRLYIQWATLFSRRALNAARRDELIAAMDPDLCAVKGAKIFADGAIGSATAAVYRPYKTTGGTGQLIYNPERLHEMVIVAAEAGWSVAVHAIGDYATDLVLDAFAATPDPAKHRLEHAMIVSDAQIERTVGMGVHVTVQPEFLHRFGRSYKAQLADDIFPELKPLARWVRAGARLSLNTDRPIVPGDLWIGIETAANRPEGFNPAENVDRDTAFAMATTGGADANNDPGEGVLAEGKWADFVAYEGEPSSATKRMTVMGGRVTWEQPG
jgi:predicted amidohydrolase YtcJ